MQAKGGNNVKIAPILIVFFLLLTPLSLAQDLDFYIPTTHVFSDNSAQTEISITLGENFTSPFRIDLFDIKIETLETEATFRDFTCDQKETAYGLYLECDTFLATGNYRSFTIKYDNTRIVKQDGTNYLLEQDFAIPYIAKTSIIKVFLPEGTVVRENQHYLPSHGTSSSDGRRIVVIWRDNDLSANSHISIKIPYEPLPFSIPIEIILVIVALAATVLYLLNKRRKSPLIMPILKTDEKLVLKGVLNHGDGINQKILVRESGYSKAKVSKVLKSLQDRGIVTLERVGRSNKVYINRDIGKKEQNNSGNN